MDSNKIHLADTLQLEVKRKEKLEEELNELQDRIKQCIAEIEKIDKFTKFLTEQHPELFGKPEFRSSELQLKLAGTTWPEKLLYFLDRHSTGLHYGQLVELVIENKVDQNLPKDVVQKRVNAALYSLVNMGKILKSSSEGQNIYSTRSL